jgi:hypothetical protein
MEGDVLLCRPSIQASNNWFGLSFCALAEKARATGDPGPAELVATAICAVSTGSTSSNTRISLQNPEIVGRQAPDGTEVGLFDDFAVGQ